MKYFILFLFLLTGGNIYGQENPGKCYTFYSPAYLQIKEEANFGLVFRGPAFYFGMGWDISVMDKLLSYEFEDGAGFPLAKGVYSSRDNPCQRG